MYPAGSRHPGPPGPPAPGQPPFKYTIIESCDRIKDEFSYLQQANQSLRVELEKLANEKTEMQRHYVMYYEMSYGLNVEMHKQTEIAKRLNAIIAQILPFLSGEHQQQVAAAVDRAKQVTMTELNAIIGQQMHSSQQMPPHPHGHPPFMPHAAAAAMAAAGLGQAPPASAAGLLALSASLSAGSGPHLPPGAQPGGKSDPHRQPQNQDNANDQKRSGSAHSAGDHRNSFSPHLDRESDRHRSRSPLDSALDGKSNNKKRRENNNGDKVDPNASEDERSDADLVVDVANEDPISPANGDVTSPRENGSGDSRIKRENRPASRSGSSSNSSTPVSKPSKDHLVSHSDSRHPALTHGILSFHQNEKPPTPVSKSITPTSSGSATPSAGQNANKTPKPATSAIGLPYSYLHGPAGPGHPGLGPAELASAAYSQGLLHNSYPRGIVSPCPDRVLVPVLTRFFVLTTGWI
jgi:groucho